MMLTERIFALKQTPPFDRLGYPELAALAEVVRLREYRAGESVAPSGYVMQGLIALIRGVVLGDNARRLPLVFGASSLLSDRPLVENLVAGEEGASCFLLTRGHFFRLINEFPEFTLGFLETAERDVRCEGGEGKPE
jgi:signal-transduction protein with cAMP-binding, CBS, and nucleotidyltransferase domain